MKNTISMAREAGFEDAYELGYYHEPLKRFEALVRADEAAKYTWDVHSCGPTCTKAACVAMREAVEAEREQIIDLVAMYGGPVDLEAAIRARGNT